ncbi:hypothetical protein BDZ94DRAFT_1237426 [Collybia nuda]|uniref:F-box domain-containing protein n=1 Tax=Collybia nuda TaxID=64659 RepID=A0A9P5Y1Q6_9AGAR|nr:hypothetical protein BDZ94DRAFT_1237426 [Collybia nuda]
MADEMEAVPSIPTVTFAHNGVLNNQDLMGQVFKHLDDNLEFESTRKEQLLWAGMTCRTFLNPALDVLWRSMHSIMPLLKVLPSFQLTNGSSYVLRGIKNEHWARYSYYARRVREMVFDPEEDDEFNMIANHTILRLAHLLPGPMLPSLRRYHAPKVDADILFIHLLFLCPSLEHLEMENCGEFTSSAVGTLLSAIGEQQLSLKHLMLRGSLSRSTLTFIPQLTRLCSLEIMGNGQFMNVDLIEKFGTLECLEHLVLDLEAAPLVRGIPLCAEGGFQRLRNLHIIGEFSLIPDVLVHISSPFMESLTIVAPPGLLSMAFPLACSTLMYTLSRKWLHSLRKVKVDHHGSTHYGTLSMISLHPLFLLPNIESLVVENYSLRVSQDDINKIAAAWPCLVTLKIPYNDDDFRPDLPTITCLSELARRCPRLETLYLPINVDANPGRAVPQPVPHNLNTLGITSFSRSIEIMDVTSILSSVHLTARYLDCLFPCIKEVKWNHYGTRGNFWSVVGDVIRMLQETRVEALRNPALSL